MPDQHPGLEIISDVIPALSEKRSAIDRHRLKCPRIFFRLYKDAIQESIRLLIRHKQFVKTKPKPKPNTKPNPNPKPNSNPNLNQNLTLTQSGLTLKNKKNEDVRNSNCNNHQNNCATSHSLLTSCFCVCL